MIARKNNILIILIILSVGIHFYAQNEIRVELQYSKLVYPIISKFLRLIFGWIPISIGDVFYLILSCWLIWIIVNFSRRIIFRKPGNCSFRESIFKIVGLLLTIYIVFNFFWGINYSRRGISSQLELNAGQYDSIQLRRINQLLLQKVNETKDSVIKSNTVISDHKLLFIAAAEAFQSTSAKYDFMKYKYSSIKPSMWGWLGNYLGFTGYYNPFTGEAQVNTTVPAFLQPYIACHEIAHQLGYAKENEANFVGYLAAKNSNNYLIQYSAYLELFMYANRTLYILDSGSSMRLRDQLTPSVKKDIKEWRDFIKSHENPIEPLITYWYGFFLKNNRQPKGLMTYNEVTSLLIHYYQKTGEI